MSGRRQIKNTAICAALSLPKQKIRKIKHKYPVISPDTSKPPAVPIPTGTPAVSMVIEPRKTDSSGSASISSFVNSAPKFRWGFYYIKAMNSIIIADTESEVTAAVNMVAKGADLTDKISWVTSHVVKNALRGVKGVVKERLAKNEK